MSFPLDKLFNKLSRRRQEDRGNTPLYLAVQEGSVNKVRRLLERGADPNIFNAKHLTPLHQAAYWGEKEIVELLLKHGAKADLDNGKGWTPLHSAAVSGGLKSRGEIIGLLLRAGANPEKADKNGFTPLDYMMAWEMDAAAAERLKQYLAQGEGAKPPAAAPKKPSHIKTPKH